MSNNFQISGAQPSKPVRFAPIYNARQATGIWTQRNPLRDAASSRLEERFYGGRNDGLIDGANIEITNRLTFARRPGSSVYNSQTFPPIDNFYPFRLFTTNSEAVKVIADTASVIYDATGPSTKSAIFTKSAGAGEAYFLSVGNTLYFGDGIDQKQWVQSSMSWVASTPYAVGNFIVDPNGNLQLVTVAGTSGTVQPTWNMTLNGFTFDGGVTWENRGSALENWGIVAPTVPPTVSQQSLTGGFSTWVASSYYTTTGRDAFPSPLFVIEDSSNRIQMATHITGTTAQTGSSLPSFGFGTVVDGTITWGFSNSAIWAATTAYTGIEVVVGVVGSTSYFFQVVNSGTSGTTTPIWPAGLGVTVNDGSILWTNIGVVQTWSDIGPNTVVEVASQEIIDSNGNIQKIQVSGDSGATVPTWNTMIGGLTTDGAAVWLNTGPVTPAGTGTAVYAYSYKNSITGGVSTASPTSFPITLGINNEVIIQGPGSFDPQVDTIVLYRSVQGGSTATLLELAEFPNPGGSLNWTYTDTTPDSGLNTLILAPVAFANNPPPVGLGKLTYHLGRIWGAVNNNVYFSGGPDVTNGNGNEAFPPANVFVFPDSVNRLYASTLGLFVFTVSDVYIIQGTTTSSFFSVPFLIGLGLQNYNAFAVNGATIYMFTSDYQIVSLDMGTGVSEVGFPVGDQFIKVTTAGIDSSLFNAATARITWHIAGSPDKGLYVSDYGTGWFRMYPTPAPETGLTWAPFATIAGGTSQVQSIETAPGVHSLLIGPKTSGPILKRDSSVFTDNGTAYDANLILGSIVLAQPGQLAELVFITTDSVALGATPSLSIQLDEIAPYSTGYFENLPAYVADPTELSPSNSMYSQRFYISQTTEPALCRNIQIRVGWGQDTVQNELLSITLYGGYSQEQ